MSKKFPISLDQPALSLSKPQLEIIDLIDADGGIQDPTATKRDSCLSVLTGEKNKLVSFLNSFTVAESTPGPGEITVNTRVLGNLTWGQLSGLSGPINTVISNITTKYKDHSERLCGIKEIPAISETPDFSTVVGVAASHHDAKASVARARGNPVEDNFSPLFNSIVGDANDEFDRVERETTNLFSRLENEGTNYLTTVSGVLNTASTNFDGTGNANSFATEDVNNFDDAVEFLNKISRASFFVGLAGSKNTHERFLVDNFIGDTKLKNLLFEADNEEDARFTFE